VHAYPSTQDLYNCLNLCHSYHSEFFFKEIKEILPLDGINRWPEIKTTSSDTTKKSQILFSLVCFDPHVSDTSSQFLPFQKWAAKAKKLTLKMLLLSFLSNEHESITLAINNFPMIDIFMC
jgi:adenine-specific DNA methylase